jgi:hypothetical protein
MRQIALRLLAVLVLAALGAVGGVAAIRALELPPADGVPLAGLVQSVEKRHAGFVRSIEYERDWWRFGGAWELEVCAETCVKLSIDAATGEELAREADDPRDGLPPPETKGPAAIAKSFADHHLGVITEIEFAHGVWQVEFRGERGLLGALKPNLRRVFEPVRGAASKPAQTPRPRLPRTMPPRLPHDVIRI